MGLIPDTTQIISYDFTWHHNIPWETLRDSWNIILCFCAKGTIEKVLEAYCVGNGFRYAVNLSKKLTTIREKIGPSKDNASSATFGKYASRMGVNPDEISHLQHLELKDSLTSDDQDNVACIVAWQKWNIVEGPKESVRIDDPGSDGFDDFIDADSDNSERYLKVRDYYEALQELIRDYNIRINQFANWGVITEWNNKISHSIDKILEIKSQDCTMFDKKIWVVITDNGRGIEKTQNSMRYFIVKKNTEHILPQLAGAIATTTVPYVRQSKFN